MKYFTSILLILFLIKYSYTQIANPSFEVWDSNTIANTIYPNGWPLLEEEYCVRSDEASTGNYALMVSTWYYYVKTNAVQKQAINYRPDALTGYYKYTENEVIALGADFAVEDTALVIVYLTKWNGALLQNDTIGYGRLPLHQSLNYSNFNCIINYQSAEIPDSIIMIFDPSIVRRYEDITYYQAITADGYCSFLTIDDLALQTLTDITDLAEKDLIQIFPNPTYDYLQISLPEKQITTLQITDVFGKIYQQETIYSETHILPLCHLPNGLYFLTIKYEDQKKIFVHKIVKI